MNPLLKLPVCVRASACVAAGVGGLLASFVVSFLLESALVRHGLRGGPFEQRKRRLVPRLCYLDFACHLCQVGLGGRPGWDARRVGCLATAAGVLRCVDL